MRAWMRFFEEVPTVAVRVPSFNMAFLPRFKGLVEEKFHEAQSDIRPLRKQFYRRMGPQGFGSEDFAAALEQISNTCRRMEAALSDDEWLVGGTNTNEH
jgi:glutathione S-transferase